MTPIAESRSRCRAPNSAMSPATTTEPISAPTTGLFATSSPGCGPGEGEFRGAVHGEGHSPGHHERADKAAADRDERGRHQRVLSEGLLKQESEAHQRWCPSGE